MIKDINKLIADEYFVKYSVENEKDIKEVLKKELLRDKNLSFGFKDLDNGLLAYNYEKIKSDFKRNSFLLKDMDKFVLIFKELKDKRKNVLIFGDYDVDGISASASLYKGLKKFGFKDENLDFYLPDRDIGYSIHKEYIDKYLNKTDRKLAKIDFIITVDCGTSSFEEIKKIKNSGISVGVTDHHMIKNEEHQLRVDKLVSEKIASFVINQNRKEDKYPFKEISGSYVALKLVEALKEKYPRDFKTSEDKDLTEIEDISTLGVVADVMPIINENYFLVKDSLLRMKLKTTKNKAISHFYKMKAMNYGTEIMFDTNIIGFNIAPLFNARGRIDDATIGLKMLLSENDEEIVKYYETLTEINEERKEITTNTIKTIKENIDDRNKGIVVYGDDISDGIIGLIAGNIVKDYNKPTICITVKRDKNKNIEELKMSGRSLEGINIMEIIKKLDKYFREDEKGNKTYGGHEGAFGGKLIPSESNLKEFILNFYKVCNETIDDSQIKKKKDFLFILNIDNSNFKEMLRTYQGEILKYGPFGKMRQAPSILLYGTITEHIDSLNQNNGKTHRYLTLSGLPTKGTTEIFTFPIRNINEKESFLESGKKILFKYSGIIQNRYNGTNSVKNITININEYKLVK